MTKSQNVLITGVSTGIGYELAKIFVEKGYNVFGSVRKQADADRLSKDFAAYTSLRLSKQHKLQTYHATANG